MNLGIPTLLIYFYFSSELAFIMDLNLDGTNLLTKAERNIFSPQQVIFNFISHGHYNFINNKISFKTL